MIMKPKVFPTAAESIQFEYERKEDLSPNDGNNDHQKEYHVYYLSISFFENKIKLFYYITYENNYKNRENRAYDNSNPYKIHTQILPYEEMSYKYINVMINYYMHENESTQIRMMDQSEKSMLYLLNHMTQHNIGFDDLTLNYRVRSFMYRSLMKHFNKMTDEVLGEDYYNTGMDAYSCNQMVCEDIEYEVNKLKASKRIWICLSIGMLLGLVIFNIIQIFF